MPRDHAEVLMDFILASLNNEPAVKPFTYPMDDDPIEEQWRELRKYESPGGCEDDPEEEQA